METLLIEKTETLESVLYVAAVPGASKSDVNIKVDTVTFTVYVTVNKTKDLDDSVLEVFTFERSTNFKVDEKYSLKTLSAKVVNGILTIKLTTEADRIKEVEVG